MLMQAFAEFETPEEAVRVRPALYHARSNADIAARFQMLLLHLLVRQRKVPGGCMSLTSDGPGPVLSDPHDDA